MGLFASYNRFAASVVGLLTFLWAAKWFVDGQYVAAVLISLGGHAIIPWKRSRQFVSFGKLGVGGFWTERIAFFLWMIFVFLGIVALAAANALPPT
jgi:hypothetical protein